MERSEKLNHVVERFSRGAFQPPRPLAQIRDSDLFHDIDNRLARFLHHVSNGATGFVGTRAALIKILADTTDRRKRSFNVPDNRRQRNMLWRTGKPVASRNTPPALNSANGLQIIENLFEKLFWDVLRIGNRLDAHHMFAIIPSEHQQRPQRIFSTNRKLH